MNKTANYQLNQWVKSDRVLMDDFNADNEKIDAAIAKCGNCRVRVSTYVGDGTGTRIHTFEHMPALVGFFGVNTFILTVPEQTSLPLVHITHTNMVTVVWGRNSITLGTENSSSADICNTKDMLYTMVVFDGVSEG